MVGQGEGCIRNRDLILNGTAKPLMLKELFNHRILALAGTAEVVEEKLNHDSRLAFSNRIARVITVDRC